MGNCFWLFFVVLNLLVVFRSEPESVAIIKQLYEDLTLPNTYAIYEEESFNIIKTHIQQISKGLRHDLFFNIMEKLYKRES